MDNTGHTKSDFSSLEESLFEAYSTKKWKLQWRLFRLARNWPAIVGAEVGRLTAPAFFRQDILWIFVQDSAWMHHLQFIKLDLLSRVNTVLAEQPITDIRWLLQPPILSPPEHCTSKAHAVDPVQEQSFRQMTESVSNQESREALRRLWQTFASHME